LKYAYLIDILKINVYLFNRKNGRIFLPF